MAKKSEKKNKGIYQDKLNWDDRTYGELTHHIGKKMTQKTHKSKLDYTRKPKYKTWEKFEDNEE